MRDPYRPMDNKAVADQILREKKKFVQVGNLKLATAIRVAGHRLGGVITVQRVKGGFRLVKSTAKVTHRPKKPKPTPKKKPAKKTAPKRK